MNRRRKRTKATHTSKFTLLPCALITFLVVFMIVPISTALSAGIAALSAVIFSLSLIICLVLFAMRPHGERKYIVIAFIAACFGLVVPQTAFIITAHKHGVNLSFNPATYLTFSGETTMDPERTIVYKSDYGRPMNLAFYKTKMGGQRPSVLLLHGGGWRYGNHLETGDWPRVLTDAGFHVFSVEYRLSNDTYQTWRDAPKDVHQAVEYLRENAAELSVDPLRLHLMGQSAGGHLALLEAYMHNDVSSVVSLYAPIDLMLDYQTSRDKSAELDFVGGPPNQYASRYRAVSPITYVSAYAPRSLIVQGKTDDLVAPQNAIQLATALRENSIEHEVLLLPMTGHSFENQRGGFATQITEQRVVQFLSQ
jgi:dipeptidyl aminopeptidase/acylaminoacyl peptidase